jgi:ATP-binding cassette subfamily B protein
MSERQIFSTTAVRGYFSRFRDLPRALMLVWSAARGWTLAWLVLLVLQGLLPVATVYLTRALVDRLAAVLGAGATWSNLRPLAVTATILAVILLLGDLLRGVTGWVRTAQSERLNEHVSDLIHRQSLAADLAFYEWPEFFDRLHRARREAGYRPVALVESLGSLLQNGITLVAMGAVLIPYGAWLPVVLFVSTLPALWVVVHFTLRQNQWRQRSTPDERRIWYYDWLLTSAEAAAEVRLFGLGGHFRALHGALRRRLRDERMRLAGH